MEERRQYERQAVSWPVRLWVSESFFLAGQAMNAGAHGAWVTLSWVPSGVLKLGEAYRLDLLPSLPERSAFSAVVARVTRQGIGVEVEGQLPFDPAAERGVQVAAAVA